MTIHGKLQRGGEGRARWEAAIGLPSRCTAGMVSAYGGFRESSPGHIARRELPSPYLTLLIGLDGPLTLNVDTGSPSSTHTSAALVGIGCGPLVASHDDAQTVLEARLSPFAALRLFGVPASELAGNITPLADLRSGASDFREQLAAAASWSGRFQILDSAVLAHARRGRPISTTLGWAWQQLLNSVGNVGVASLNEQTRMSRRGLADGFREQLGLPPKAMARLLRFHQAATLLVQHRCSLTEVALSCGYYDQAHLHRDFRSLAACTPQEFRRAVLADAARTGMMASTAPADSTAQTSKTEHWART